MRRKALENVEESENVERIEESFKLYQKGLVHYNNNRISLAKDYFLSSLVLFKDYKPYRMLSKIYDKQGDFDKKFFYIEKSYHSSTIQDVVGKEYAEMLIEKNKIDEAISILKKIISRNKTYKPGIILLEKIKEIDNMKSCDSTSI